MTKEGAAMQDGEPPVWIQNCWTMVPHDFSCYLISTTIVQWTVFRYESAKVGWWPVDQVMCRWWHRCQLISFLGISTVATTAMANILYIMTAVIFQSLSYLTVLTLLVITLSSESKWFCFAGIMSTVVISVIASHIGKQADEYNVMMQFIFWLIEWGILGWFQSMLSYTGTSGTIDVFAIVAL